MKRYRIQSHRKACARKNTTEYKFPANWKSPNGHKKSAANRGPIRDIFKSGSHGLAAQATTSFTKAWFEPKVIVFMSSIEPALESCGARGVFKITSTLIHSYLYSCMCMYLCLNKSHSRHNKSHINKSNASNIIPELLGTDREVSSELVCTCRTRRAAHPSSFRFSWRFDSNSCAFPSRVVWFHHRS